MMKWLANATKKDAKVILNVWPDLKIGPPVPVELEKEELVGIYGNYPTVRKEKDEDTN
ncbi:hypothetical protein LCGC14_1125350 [marine sediment metagenome]|uniref:Uncharacterized protein n=1 Tax=marine sediment metagenome TaxID=412755 RepID=A0A0F9M2S0_9ZZZZ